jgi:hypothetical protein
MIYSASYFMPSHHHGRLYSISRSAPASFRRVDAIPFFVPDTPEIKRLDKKTADFIEQYTVLYRQLWRDRLPLIRDWMEGLDPDIDATILCWEKSPNFCHRNLVMKAVAYYRPDCYGGQDIARIVEAPRQLSIL